jgi:superfamily II DNA or RNA helicase
MISALSQDEERNILIVSDILAETADPRARAIVVCERRAHMERLKGMLEENYRVAETVSAITRPGDLEHTINRFDRGKLQVICVTVRSLHLAKVKRVSHLFMASPVSHGEFVAQAVGKILWTKGEASRVFDYLDRPVALRGAFKKRLKIYGGMGVRYESNRKRGCLCAVTDILPNSFKAEVKSQFDNIRH